MLGQAFLTGSIGCVVRRDDNGHRSDAAQPLVNATEAKTAGPRPDWIFVDAAANGHFCTSINLTSGFIVAIEQLPHIGGLFSPNP